MKMCPLTGDSCMKHDCEWYIQVMGSNPQNGQDVNQWGCAISFMPLLLIENAQQTRQAGAAVESFRNEVVERNDKLLGILAQARLGNR